MHKCTSYWPGQAQCMTILTFIWPLWPWPSTFLKKMFHMALLLLKGNNCAKLFWNPCINVQVMLRTSSIHVYDHFDLYLTPVTLTFNLPKKMFQMALLLLKGNNCAKLFWNPCINVKVMVWTNPVGRTHGLTDSRMHSNTPSWNCNNYVSLTRKRARQKWWTNFRTCKAWKWPF